MIDFGTIYDGYYSDITRTIGFGEVKPEIRETYEILLAAQKSAVQKVSFNKTLGEIDQVARQALRKEDLRIILVIIWDMALVFLVMNIRP